MLVKARMQLVSLDELLEEMWKTIEKGGKAEDRPTVKAKSGIFEVQRQDMKTVETLLENVKVAKTRDLVYIQSAIAVGYANAMQAHGIIEEDELKRLNAMIGTIAERRLLEVEKQSRKEAIKALFHFGKAAQ